MIDGEIIENEELNLKLDTEKNCVEAIPVVKKYENVIKFRKRGIFNLAYKQGLLFKIFKKSDKFQEMFKEIGVSKLAIYFKLKLAKILEKYSKLKLSLLSLNFMKNYMKSKQFCKESGNEFEKF